MHGGDRARPQLRELDALAASELTYPSWPDDVSKAERMHVEFPVLFEASLETIRKKQKIHMGDREHEQLRALDALAASGLTYVSRKADVRRAETYHVAIPSLFASALEEMRSKQQIHAGNRTHLELHALDALVASGLTYVR